jgi:hypothetical protein
MEGMRWRDNPVQEDEKELKIILPALSGCSTVEITRRTTTKFIA